MSDAGYKNHDIHNTLKQILAMQTDEEILRLPTPLTDEQQWQYDRIFDVARVVEGYLDQTPSTLVSKSSLANLQSGLLSIHGELVSFRSSKNPTSLTNASTYVDGNVIPHLVAFAPKLKAITSGKLGEIVDDVRNRSHQAIKEIANEKDALSKELAEQAKLITDQKAQIAELSLAVETQKKEAVGVTAVVTGKYAETETALREKFQTTLAGMEEKYGKFQLDTETKADTHLNELNKKEEKAKDILGLIGDQALTGNYKLIADQETHSADIWRRITVAVFTVAIAVGIVALFSYKDGRGELELAVLRMLFAIVVSFAAFYTGRESARHRTNAENARRLELELAVLSPYIQDLDKSIQDGLKKELAPNYFGKTVAPHEVKSPVELKGVEGLLKALGEFVEKARK